MALGEKIKKLRLQHGLTQEDLGQLVNLAESTISLYESNKRSPDYDTLLKIADFFKVSTDYLLCRTPNFSTDQIKEAEEDYNFKTGSILDLLAQELPKMNEDEQEFLTEHILFALKQIAKGKQRNR